MEILARIHAREYKRELTDLYPPVTQVEEVLGTLIDVESALVSLNDGLTE